MTDDCPGSGMPILVHVLGDGSHVVDSQCPVCHQPVANGKRRVGDAPVYLDHPAKR